MNSLAFLLGNLTDFLKFIEGHGSGILEIQLPAKY